MKKVLIAVLLILVVLTSTALAGENEIAFDTANIEDGQTEVPLDIAVELVFTNNVVNKDVAEGNAQCISLTSRSKEVAIDIVMADDQIEPDKKRIIEVIPKEKLKEGQLYELKVSSELTAKNGRKISDDIIISFTTKGAVQSGFFSYWWIIVIAAIAVIAVAGIVLVKKKSGSKE